MIPTFLRYKKSITQDIVEEILCVKPGSLNDYDFGGLENKLFMFYYMQGIGVGKAFILTTMKTRYFN